MESQRYARRLPMEPQHRHDVQPRSASTQLVPHIRYLSRCNDDLFIQFQGKQRIASICSIRHGCFTAYADFLQSSSGLVLIGCLLELGSSTLGKSLKGECVYANKKDQTSSPGLQNNNKRVFNTAALRCCR
ncbi:Hypothetical predicted protein [Scomber scombrus]|uniref:Uncharacterized protein n=1 Tax=Scomber scombrus TaxID=13677 RepID=A0AAV1Q1B5_SCOSC